MDNLEQLNPCKAGAVSTTKRGESGLSLVEMMIALSGVAAILLVVYSVVTSTSEISDSTQEFSILNRRVHAATERVLGQLYQAQAGEIDIGLAGNTLTFKKTTSYVDGDVVSGNTCVIEMVSDPNDPFDGEDNDGDGLTDESDVVLRTDLGLPSEQTTVLAQDLQYFVENETEGEPDKHGLNFTLTGRVLTIEIGMSLVQQNGEILKRSAETSFTLRN